MKVLHIASWYPHSKDPFDGDFVQRHAQALSLYMRVDVIHVVQQFHLLQGEEGHVEEMNDGNLFSKVFFPAFPKTKNRFLQKLMFAGTYNQAMRKALHQYLQDHGKPDLVHVHVPVKAGYAALYLKKKLGIPFVVTEHSSAYFVGTANNYFEASRYFRFITRQSFEQAAMVSSVSNWLLNHLNELFAISNTRLVRNVVNTKLFYPVTKTGTKKRFLHVSMMFPMKNVEGIIDALYLLQRQTQDWEMVFVGNAGEALQQKAKGLGHQVHWTGTLSYAAVAGEMQAADALIHFSTYENLPCVINEALCCGVPVISSRVGGIDELVNETNGILVESSNTQALVNAMMMFLQQPDRFNKTTISNHAIARFSYEAVGKQLLDMYVEVLGKKSS
ncbi:MAG TPA: glycosyltransferase family 4 protein [Lacibacter sp.]|nr:glycosyltransferase family 4 protein [Lacibacter sp.]